MALPMPRPAPVMIATSLVRRMVISGDAERRESGFPRGAWEPGYEWASTRSVGTRTGRWAQPTLLGRKFEREVVLGFNDDLGRLNLVTARNWRIDFSTGELGFDLLGFFGSHRRTVVCRERGPASGRHFKRDLMRAHNGARLRLNADGGKREGSVVTDRAAGLPPRVPGFASRLVGGVHRIEDDCSPRRRLAVAGRDGAAHLHELVRI